MSARSVIGLVCALGLLAAPAAQADSGRYVAVSFKQPAAGGLPITGRLSEFVAVSSARVVVPVEWRRQSAPTGQLRFLTGSRSCSYRVTFSTRGVLAAPGDPLAYVDAALPLVPNARLLDRGVRTAGAWRVIKTPLARPGVRLRGIRAGVLTRRADIVPAGQQAWGEVRVNATSRPSDECHSGTYRQRLGPQIADALATARVGLNFRPAP